MKRAMTAAPHVACPVLVVEDDRDLREMMAQLLAWEGFDPVWAAILQKPMDYDRLLEAVRANC